MATDSMPSNFAVSQMAMPSMAPRRLLETDSDSFTPMGPPPVRPPTSSYSGPMQTLQPSMMPRRLLETDIQPGNPFASMPLAPQQPSFPSMAPRRLLETDNSPLSAQPTPAPLSAPLPLLSQISSLHVLNDLLGVLPLCRR